MQSGFLKATILLPTLDYDEKDLYYIIKHEMIHFHNRDVWIKLLLNIWKCIFWWYPFTYLLCSKIDESLELKCDSIVIHELTLAQRKEYLTALLHAYEKQSRALEENKTFTRQFASLYQKEEILIQRFRYIQSHRYNANSFFVIFMFCILFLQSYFFIFQAYTTPTYPPNSEWTYFSPEDTYIIKNNTGNYELYINHSFQSIIEKDVALQMIQSGVPLKTERKYICEN